MNHFLRELAALGVPVALGSAAIIWKYRNPQLYASNVVAPGSRFNRLQHIGLAFLILGVVLTTGIQTIGRFHPLDPNFRAGELGGSEGYILIGIALFLFGWKRRRNPDSSRPD